MLENCGKHPIAGNVSVGKIICKPLLRVFEADLQSTKFIQIMEPVIIYLYLPMVNLPIPERSFTISIDVNLFLISSFFTFSP